MTYTSIMDAARRQKVNTVRKPRTTSDEFWSAALAEWDREFRRERRAAITVNIRKNER